ncbi:MAG: glycerol kinase GlpK [Clostridiales bacterium]|nr:glycerol kinase GlpK [Clostridiales bacterium]
MGKQRYILALDQGTTSTRAVIFNESGEAVACAQREFAQIYPHAGWVEHDPREILSTALGVMAEAAAHVDPSSIAAMGITNQRETVVVWEKDGTPVYNAVVWQCRRTADACRALIEGGYSETIYKKTGLIPDAYFSATKIKWILDNVAGAREKAKSGKLYAGTIDTYLLYCLSGGKIFATDYTNAARTMLFNIHEKKWDDELLSLFDIPVGLLPQVYPSAHFFGVTQKRVLGRELPVCGVAGDQQAALYGQGCVGEGQVKCTFGTGVFLLCNTGERAVRSSHGLLTTLAAARNGAPFALEGSVFVGGAAVQWLRDEMKLIHSAAESEEVALSVKSSGGVYVVPSFVGLGAPYWDSGARGLICGITRGTGRAHIVRATLESIAYQTADVLFAMQNDTGRALTRLRVDGGASANNFLMQFLADITGAEIVRSRCVETTALGAARLAAVASGENVFTAGDDDRIDCVFAPNMKQSEREEALCGWSSAVSRARSNTEK